MSDVDLGTSGWTEGHGSNLSPMGSLVPDSIIVFSIAE